MPGLFEYVGVSSRLYARNRLALVYSLLFPIVFLGALLALYRHESVKLIRHMGELLTIGILGGACFGLPTTLVNERELGVWRRYRLVPLPLGRFVAGTLAVRYGALVAAGVLQLAISMSIGGWAPAHPLQLLVAFSVAAFALMGLGLVIAALADTVQGVQALGQVVFLPMLIIGGVAVPVNNLGDWQWIASFLPGRHAVESIQACVDGDGLRGMGFPLAALLLMGAASFVAGTRLFRWDAQKRRLGREEWGWVAFALAAWVVVGGLALARGNEPVRRPAPATEPAVTAAPGGGGAATTAKAGEEPWRALSNFNFAALPIADMPPDDGNISPLPVGDQAPAGGSIQQLQRIRDALPNWPPGKVADPVQQVRNYLALIGAADFSQSSLERFLPEVALQQMLKQHSAEDLAKILCWIALHPDEGEIPREIDGLMQEIGVTTLSPVDVRERVYFYAVKLTRWVIGW